MVLALFTLALLAMVASSSALIGSTSVRATRNYRGASQVHFVAESAIAEALQRLDGPGVVNFQNEVVNNWSTYWPTGAHAFGGATGYTYTVTTPAAAGDPNNAGRMIATADGPEGSHNVVVANVVRSDPFGGGSSGSGSSGSGGQGSGGGPPGAVYLATDTSTDSRFYGSGFHIDGNDINYTGGAGSRPPIPGIATRNDANTQEAINSLNSSQRPLVRGSGYSSGPPTVPSVRTSPAAPSVAQMNQMISSILGRPRPPDILLGNIIGTNTWGTPASPQITHLTGVAGVLTLSGSATGAGVLIVEGDLVVLGSLNFDGLVLVRGQVIIDALPVVPSLIPNTGSVIGSLTVYGTLWTQKVVFNASGTAQVYYSSQALAVANQSGSSGSSSSSSSGGGLGALPAPLMVTSLVDCTQVPAGVAACP